MAHNRALALPYVEEYSPSPSPSASSHAGHSGVQSPSFERSPSPPPAATTFKARSAAGQNQLGKKRGPYKKTQALLQQQAAGTAALVDRAPLVQLSGPLDDEGRLRGVRFVDYHENVQEVVRTIRSTFPDSCSALTICLQVKWWETMGRRPKTKKEIARLTTHPDFVPTSLDGSFNLSERMSRLCHLCSRFISC